MNSITDKVGEIVGKYSDPASDMVAVLEDVQKAYGCLPDDVLREVAARTELALVRILQVVEHRDGFVLERDMKKPVEICTCPNCSLNGGSEILKGLREILLVKSCGSGIGARYCISTFNAAGSPCVRPPTVVVDGRRYQGMKLSELVALLGASSAEPVECKPVRRYRAASL
jgi:NADH:ubiquinone oxidoreductase subunit E